MTSVQITTTAGAKMNVSAEFSEVVRNRVVRLVGRRADGTWSGTMSDFTRAIRSDKAPSAMRRVLNTIAPQLRRAGVRVQFGRTTDHMRTRIVRFTAV